MFSRFETLWDHNERKEDPKLTRHELKFKLNARAAIGSTHDDFNESQTTRKQSSRRARWWQNES